MATTAHASQLADWQPVLKLVNERYPILLKAGDIEVRERIQSAKIVTRGDGQSVDLAMVTYRGKQLQFHGVERVELNILERDKQGVPVAYEVVLHYSAQGSQNGSEVLQFYA